MAYLRKITIAALLISAFLSLRCGGGELIPTGSPEERLAHASGYLEQGKGERALEAYRAIARIYPDTEWEEAARLGAARAQRKMKDYPAAIQELETFIRRYPRSGFRDDAALEIALCYMDQRKKPELDPEMTNRALGRLNDFLSEYPESDRAGEAKEMILLCRTESARKALANGITYVKLRRYVAARFYFRIVVDEYGETEIAPEALFEIGKTWEREKNRVEMSAVHEEMVRLYPRSEWTGLLGGQLAVPAEAGEGDGS